MTKFIRCPTCNMCIGLYDEFVECARQALFIDTISKDKTISNYDPEKLALNPGLLPSLEEIYEALMIENICCRMRILTLVQFDKTYKT